MRQRSKLLHVSSSWLAALNNAPMSSPGLAATTQQGGSPQNAITCFSASSCVLVFTPKSTFCCVTSMCGGSWLPVSISLSLSTPLPSRAESSVERRLSTDDRQTCRNCSACSVQRHPVRTPSKWVLLG